MGVFSDATASLLNKVMDAAQKAGKMNDDEEERVLRARIAQLQMEVAAEERRQFSGTAGPLSYRTVNMGFYASSNNVMAQLGNYLRQIIPAGWDFELRVDYVQDQILLALRQPDGSSNVIPLITRSDLEDGYGMSTAVNRARQYFALPTLPPEDIRPDRSVGLDDWLVPIKRSTGDVEVVPLSPGQQNMARKMYPTMPAADAYVLYAKLTKQERLEDQRFAAKQKLMEEAVAKTTEPEPDLTKPPSRDLIFE